MRTFIPPYDVIRGHYFNDAMSMRDIAKMYGTCHTAIYRNAEKAARAAEDQWPFTRKVWPGYQKLKHEYIRGASWQDIAAKYDLNQYGVRDRMRRNAETLGEPWPIRRRISNGGVDRITTAGIRGELIDFKKNFGVSQARLAIEAGVHRSYISRLVTGKRTASGTYAANPMMSREHAERIMAAIERLEKAAHRKTGAAYALKCRQNQIAERKAA